MKKTLFATLATALVMPVLYAQETTKTPSDTTKTATDYRKEAKLQDLEAEKKRVEEQEKFKLKQALNLINEKLAAKEISTDEAQQMKLDAAKEAAMNIDNKLAIIQNQKQLVERGVNYTFEFEGGRTFEVGLGNAIDDNGSAMLGIAYENRNKKVPYDKRTYSDITMVGGFNNTFSGAALKDSPFKIWKSGYAEFGVTFRTRILKDDNYWRLAYGSAIQVQSLELTQNRYFVPNGEQTSFEPFPFDLKRTKLRIYNLIFPVYLEFGDSKKTESYDRIRYNTLSHVRYGIGGFGGVNIGNMQTFRYDENNRRIDIRDKRSVNPSTFVYGVGAYVGIGPLALQATYNFNNIFKDGPASQNLMSLGFRLDL